LVVAKAVTDAAIEGKRPLCRLLDRRLTLFQKWIRECSAPSSGVGGPAGLPLAERAAAGSRGAAGWTL